MVIFKRHVIPHWGCADTWVKYRAQDLNGDWYFFDLKPTINNKTCSWDCKGEKFTIFSAMDTYPDNKNWKATLEKKPSKYNIVFNNIKIGNFVILSNNQIGRISSIYGDPYTSDDPTIRSSFRITLFNIKTHVIDAVYFDNYFINTNIGFPNWGGNHSVVTGCYIGSEINKYISKFQNIIVIDIFTKDEISII